MKLYIGGAGHGQELIAEQETGLKPETCDAQQALTAKAIGQFHLLTKQLVKEGASAQDFALELIQKNPDAVICCDEIGCGIHPMEREDRIWREETGRALCILAKHSERVVRAFCGIGQVIK